MQCFVYASRRRADTYVWLRQRDDVDVIPADLRETLGELRFVIDVQLHADRQLPHADASVVLARLHSQGWYLQLPPAQD
jgi:uncharacterized protein